jgi:hypothetical protein
VQLSLSGGVGWRGLTAGVTLVRGWPADVRLTTVQMECYVAGNGDGELPGHYY